MGIKSKYSGIDEREVKCCCDNPNCGEAGISFNEQYLRFHYLEYETIGGSIMLQQKTKAMMINQENAAQLIELLKPYAKKKRR